MKRVIVLCFLYAFFLSVNAQFLDNSLYVKGFITTIFNDTINGYIAFDNDYFGRVKYKINKDDKKSQKIDTKHVRNLKVGNDVFENIAYKKDYYLMKRISKGEISAYKDIRKKPSIMMPTGTFMSAGSAMPTSYMMTNSGEKEFYYLVKDARIVKIKKRKLKELLKELMNDYTDIYPEIDQMKTNYSTLEFQLRDLLKMYNYRIK
jgi:hypothetical protein